MTKTVKQWKFLRTGMKSSFGNMKWKVGKWERLEGDLQICRAGFHSSNDPYHAFSSVQGEILARVECRGEHIDKDNKSCWREQRVIKAYKWTKKDSLKLAIFSAELVLKNYEGKYPGDPRPRQAIEAAKKVLFRDTEYNRSAAESAESAAESAAWSAWSASSASSARSAASSASSARSAARSAWSAESAESAAWSAAWSAESDESATIEKIQKYFMKLVKDLKPL